MFILIFANVFGDGCRHGMQQERKLNVGEAAALFVGLEAELTDTVDCEVTQLFAVLALCGFVFCQDVEDNGNEFRFADSFAVATAGGFGDGGPGCLARLSMRCFREKFVHHAGDGLNDCLPGPATCELRKFLSEKTAERAGKCFLFGGAVHTLKVGSGGFHECASGVFVGGTEWDGQSVD